MNYDYKDGLAISKQFKDLIYYMKNVFILITFICMANLLAAQESLSSMPITKRDSILVEIAQKVLKDKYPQYYRKDGIHPTIIQRDFSFLRLEKDTGYYTPKYIEPEDSFYVVTIYYDKWREENFAYEYTGKVFIIEKTQEALAIHLGACNMGYSLLKPKEKK